MITKHILIKGKVQGVFFRASAQETAEKLGITGWVKNTENGDVEVVASGNDDAVKKFINWCHQGPRRAEVAEVIVTDAEENKYFDFRQVRY
jgi:acylphosphatase